MERVRMGDPFLWIPGRRAPSGPGGRAQAGGFRWLSDPCRGCVTALANFFGLGGGGGSLPVEGQVLAPFLVAGCRGAGGWPAVEVGGCLAERSGKAGDIEVLDERLASGAGGELADLRRQGVVR